MDGAGRAAASHPLQPEPAAADPIWRRRDGKQVAWIEENAVDGEHPYAPYLASHVTPEYGTICRRGRHAAALDDAQADDGAGQALSGVLQPLRRAGAADGDAGLGRCAGAIHRRQGLYLFRARQPRFGQPGRAISNSRSTARWAAVEVRDQKAGARFLKSLDFVDPAKDRDLWLVLRRLHDAQAAGSRPRASSLLASPARR